MGTVQAINLSVIAAVSVIAGVLVITWMVLSRLNLSGVTFWPHAWAAWRCPIHPLASGIVGTAAIVLVGLALAWLRPSPSPDSPQQFQCKALTDSPSPLAEN